MDSAANQTPVSPSRTAPSAAPAGPMFAIALPSSAQAALVLLVVFLLGVLVGISWWRPTTPPPGLVLDLNRMSAAELRMLPGVGEQLSQRIEEHRRQHGPFRSLEDLKRVPGFGPKTYQQVHAYFSNSAILEEDATSPTSTVVGSTALRTKKGEDLSEPIDLNSATLEELQKLPGVGPKISQRIIDERTKKPFRSVQDFRRVPGIGPKTYDKLKPLVTVRDAVVAEE